MSPIICVDVPTAPPPAESSTSDRACVSTSLTDETVVQCDDDYVQWYSRLQEGFEEGIDPDFFARFKRYVKVEVLLLSWQCDDMNVKTEIDELEEVFTTLFKFRCQRAAIKQAKGHTAQTDLFKHVINWVHGKDSTKTLFIVYFAGHGKSSRVSPGDLILHARAKSGDVQNYLNEASWNQAEQLLRAVEADILQIFDCCYAGTIGSRAECSRRIEYLAASKDKTKSPGESSFTKALIWALRDLAKDNGSFTTATLVNRIQQAPKFPHDQKPLLLDRHGSPGNGRIVLRPMKEDELDPEELKSEKESENSESDVVVLKFMFGSRPTPEDMKALAKDLGYSINGHKLNVVEIMWGGVYNNRNLWDKFGDERVLQAVSRLIQPVISKRRKSMETSRRQTITESSSMSSEVPPAANTLDLMRKLKSHIEGQVDVRFQARVQEFTASTAAKRHENLRETGC